MQNHINTRHTFCFKLVLLKMSKDSGKDVEHRPLRVHVEGSIGKIRLL